MPMTKNKKQTLLLCILLSVLFLASCSSHIKDEHTVAESEYFFSSLEVMSPINTNDYGEEVTIPKSFTVLCEAGREGEMFASAEDISADSKLIFERNARLAEKHGMTLSLISSEDIAKKVSADVLSGDVDYDMLLLGAKSGAELILSGSLADLAGISGFSTSDAGYSEKVISDLSLGEKVFLVSGDATPSLIRSASSVLINTELAKNIMAGGNINNIALNHHFTYETMQKYAIELMSLNGSVGKDPSVAMSIDPAFAMDLYFGLGGSFISYDSVTDMPQPVSFDGQNKNVYSVLKDLFGISDKEQDGEEFETTEYITPLFTVATLGELEGLLKENAPFSALPMPKMSVIQKDYRSSADLSVISFTALPKGKGESELAAMELIYKSSEDLKNSVLGLCTQNEDGVGQLIYESIGCDILSFFGYGDIPSLMSSCILERTGEKAFELKASERSRAAATALSIMRNKIEQSK